MNVVPVVFLGTPRFASHCLRALIDDEHYDVVGVVTQPDRPAGRKMRLTPSSVKQLAIENNIEVITPDSVNTEESLAKVRSWNAEAAVVVAYGQIVSQKFLDLFPAKVVNVHASLLPRWRGAAPIQRAIMAGDTVTGVSLQVMVKQLDAGAVLGERRIEIDDNMDALSLHDSLMNLATELLNVEFTDYLRGQSIPAAQDESEVTYAEKIAKAESEILWTWSARQIFNHIRGMRMGPGSMTLYQGKKFKIHQVTVESETGCLAPAGQVAQVDDESFVVACGEGALRIFSVQPESRAKMSVADYLKGYPLKPGDRLGE